MLYVNGCTDGLHMEKDCNFTSITVPRQSFKNSSKTLREEAMFIFNLIEEQQLILLLVRGIIYVYNARCVTHHKEYRRQVEDS